MSVLLPFPWGRSDIFGLRNCFICLKNVIVHVSDTGPLFHYIDIQDICAFLQYFSVSDNLWRLAELFLATQMIAALISFLVFCMDSETPCITHYWTQMTISDAKLGHSLVGWFLLSYMIIMLSQKRGLAHKPFVVCFCWVMLWPWGISEKKVPAQIIPSRATLHVSYVFLVCHWVNMRFHFTLRKTATERNKMPKTVYGNDAACY
jgi:hypothetical protein